MGALDGRVALVTGGASGIGRATVARMREAGARVAVADLRDCGDTADLAIVADVADPAAWPGITAAVERGLGGLDVVHLNAGVVTGDTTIDSLSDETYRRVMRVNVDHVVFGVRAVTPVLERRGGGRIVATASLAGLTAWPVDPLYTLTKHAVVGLVRSLGQPLAARGIRINAVCPGIVDTPMIDEAGQRLRELGFPLLEADDIAGAVMRILDVGEPGQCWFVQPGREPAAFEFRNVPGPRTPGAVGMSPPL